MAIAHVCMHCGLDLARTRPRRDPHYGLPIIFCPRCGAFSVRLHHAIPRRWRSFLRIKTSVCLALMNALVLLALASMNVAAAAQLADDFPRGNMIGDLLAGESYELVAFLIILPLITGTWLSIGLHHLRLVSVWIGWVVFMLLLLGSGILITMADHALNSGPTYFGTSNPALDFLLQSACVAGMMVIAIAGIPLSHLLRRAYLQHRRHHWRRRRRRFRARRIAA